MQERPRIILEAALVYAAFYLAALVPADASAAATLFSRPAFYLATMAQLLPRAGLLLYLMHRAGTLAALGPARPRPRAFPESALLAALAFGLALAPILAARSLGVEASNPLLDRIAPPAGPLGTLLLAAGMALAVGYSEELFFRAYLLDRLGEAGLGPRTALLASTAAFSLSHGAQGWIGLLGAALIGAAFGLYWQRRRDFHALALGHAAYDLLVLALAFYGPS